VIFVTVGTQLAFDRMVSAVDSWAAQAPGIEIHAQIGPSDLKPKNLKFSAFLKPQDADALFRSSSLIVAHAGMGSILTALRHKKPILIMPRKASLGEHRNDHQMATAKWLGSRPGVSVAWNEKELQSVLDNHKELNSGAGISDFASPELIQNLKSFIRG
jgi:UDP-N-acetylglucosamine transferase subunit ALG13